MTAIILFCALSYAFWRIYKAFHDKESPCKDCELKKKLQKIWPVQIKVLPLHPHSRNGALTHGQPPMLRRAETVPWMSGLVNGLQNRLRRFESARHLRSN